MLMEAKAKVKYLRMSPRKVRLVADLIRGKQVDQAIAVLRAVRKRAADPVRKVVRSAAANAISEAGSARLHASDLTVTRIIVDGGPSYRRFRAGPMGRANRYKHRTCHISVVVQGEAREERSRRRAS
ncbi:MAG: 50S ribosomal protein L22 [bacterium]